MTEATGPVAAFTQQQIRDLLTELGADLNSRGIRAELFVVGGAAMCLAYNTRRTTRDVDAVFEPTSEIRAAARRVAATHELPDDWLNDAMKGYLPGPDPHQRAVLAAPGINVSVPSPEYLLAMKVAAARVDRDPDDIRTLAHLCGANTAEEVLAITERVMGGRQPLLPKTQFLIEEMFPPSVPASPSLWRRLKEQATGWAHAHPQARNARPLKPPRPPLFQGRCGAPTGSGRPCRNRRGSCPAHR